MCSSASSACGDLVLACSSKYLRRACARQAASLIRPVAYSASKPRMPSACRTLVKSFR
jgi:hypothetical protein